MYQMSVKRGMAFNSVYDAAMESMDPVYELCTLESYALMLVLLYVMYDQKFRRAGVV